MPEAAYEVLVETIRRVTGNVGTVERLGRSLAWKARRSASVVYVTVVPRDGRTAIRVENSLGARDPRTEAARTS